MVFPLYLQTTNSEKLMQWLRQNAQHLAIGNTWFMTPEEVTDISEFLFLQVQYSSVNERQTKFCQPVYWHKPSKIHYQQDYATTFLTSPLHLPPKNPNFLERETFRTFFPIIIICQSCISFQKSTKWVLLFFKTIRFLIFNFFCCLALEQQMSAAYCTNKAISLPH